MKMTDIKTLIQAGAATDITTYSDVECCRLRDQEGDLEKIEVTHGKYGMNGALFKGRNSGKLFGIVGRCSTLFYLV